MYPNNIIKRIIIYHIFTNFTIETHVITYLVGMINILLFNICKFSHILIYLYHILVKCVTCQIPICST